MATVHHRVTECVLQIDTSVRLHVQRPSVRTANATLLTQ